MPQQLLPQGKTAYEVVMGKKPVVSHLKPFGSVGYVHIDKSLRSKLDDTSVKGVLIGYANECNYRMWLPESEKIVTTRHVTFGNREELNFSRTDDEEFVPVEHHRRTPAAEESEEIPAPAQEYQPAPAQPTATEGQCAGPKAWLRTLSIAIRS